MKLKVMLVDDELLVRLGVKSLIDWEEHDFEYIGDAADGEKALELMERQAPDILLTDIVMPRMDGLALIEAVKHRYPNTLIIVLSSHNEFEYVRKAMKLGVEDYLLKTSMKPSELLELLVEASRKLAEKRERKPAADAVSQGLEGSEAPASAYESRRERMAEQLTIRLLGHSVQGEELPPGRYLLMLGIKSRRDGELEQSVTRLLEHLIESELAAVLDSRPVPIREGEMAALLARPEQAEQAPDSVANSERPHELERAVSQLVNASNRLLGITLHAETSGLLADWAAAADFYEAFREKLTEPAPREPAREDIKRLLDYMSANIAQDISLKQAADMINMSESYLSTIFKKETGLGFTDWINVKRIDQAAAYLEETSLPSYTIAEQVGYENINYFGRIFKKLKGASPQKYRAQRQKQ
ncbi:response regulator [Paenibacillus kobensis]|uniref:response regulator n=1 Tax=Paenibacillus kobensis TaxID=59841 RepID=UPI000FD93000|nr:response regulator [Paenibacillus kobensis]